MSRIQALSDGLNSVFTDKKTGKLFIIGKQENSTRLGTIVVREGEIVGIEYCGKYNDEALPLLLSSEIRQARFIEGPVAESDRPTNLTSIASILGQIGNDATQTRQSDTPITHEIDLKSEALKLLESLFGAAASKKVDKIATKYPPSVQPLEFLAGCKKIIEPAFGKAVAEQTLTHLHRRLKEDELR